MKICIILGTRPEIIKMSSIIRECKKKGLDYFLIHTNQHYSENMDKVFFDELDLPRPKYNLGIGSGKHGEMTGRMMIEIENVLEKEKPEVVLVQGDTNTVVAGALVASKMNMRVGHVEAGLRSYDREMPEEMNRIVTDHISDLLFTPTKKQVEILKNEGIEKGKIFETGNTVVDAVLEGIVLAKEKSRVLQLYDLEKEDYILMTAHRPATVDSKENLNVVLQSISEISRFYDKKIIFPIHPRTKKMIEEYNIELPSEYILIDPVGYLDMLMLQKNAFLIVTDSGGLQEESCILEKKCAVLRNNTERPEAVFIGGCFLVGNSNKRKIISQVDNLIKKDVQWINPFGDGRSAERIIKRCS